MSQKKIADIKDLTGEALFDMAKNAEVTDNPYVHDWSYLSENDQSLWDKLALELRLLAVVF